MGSAPVSQSGRGLNLPGSDPSIVQHPSPNFGARRGGAQPELVVLHYTAMQSAQAALERLCDPAAEVSAHYLISETGHIWQLVDEAQRAWHAGAGRWRDISDVNSHSIGIELANCGDHPFPAPQMAALEGLLAGIMRRWSLTPEGVIGHSDMAPGRKFDPGPRFDWLRLEKRGLAARRGGDAGPREVSPELFRQIARAGGYTAEVEDEILLEAVRLRYRPQATGALSPEDFSPLGHAALWT